MSGVSSVSGQIWSAPIVYGPAEQTQTGFDAANGIVDDSTLKAIAGYDNESLAFLDSLTPAQLLEKTVGNFETGARVTTYGDLKIYRQTQAELDDQVAALVPTSSNISGGNLDLSKANGSDLELAQIGIMLGNLEDNMPGAVTAAQSYLKNVRSGHDHLATAPWQTVQSAAQAEASYWTSNPQGDWAASDGASVALATLKLASVRSPDALPGTSSVDNQKLLLVA